MEGGEGGGQRRDQYSHQIHCSFARAQIHVLAKAACDQLRQFSVSLLTLHHAMSSSLLHGGEREESRERERGDEW